MGLTRPQFERACELTLGNDSHSSWSWRSHQTFQHLGYLERTVTIPVRQQSGSAIEDTGEIPAEEDDSAVATSIPKFISCDQYIVYSPSFMVPAFYFNMWDQQGVQLTLDQLLQAGAFRFDPSAKFDRTTFGLSEPGSAFPLLSQGDHPVLGTRCWYFHPCESSAAVNELVNEAISPDVSEDDRLRCWMKMWFLVLGSIVSL